jgi:NAD(P)-dependent dehydrogenase (short-subunit alcohol dehydrogenase family)
MSRGQTILLTGASDGIGRATAAGLARAGARVVMVCRNREKGEAVQAALRAETGNPEIDVLLCDLASQHAIRTLAATVLAHYDRLDVLVNNAGLYTNRYHLTADGIETTFAVNHLAYFLLTNLLLDRLKASAPARIVNVASDAHERGRIDFDDLNGARHFNGWRAYAQSKLANLLFTFELARRLNATGVTANALHPGWVATNIARGTPLQGLNLLIRPLLIRPERGAETTLHLALSPDVAGTTGQYFYRKKPLQPAPAALDATTATRLWQVSAVLTGLQP